MNFKNQINQEQIAYHINSKILGAFELQIRKNKSYKIKYLQCSYDFLNNWIRYQFKDEMCFENYGSVWVIDHRKPIQFFDLRKEADINDYFCWVNMYPTFINSKITYYDTIDEINSQIRIIGFMQKYNYELLWNPIYEKYILDNSTSKNVFTKYPCFLTFQY